MDELRILVVFEDEVTEQQKLGINKLEKQCFSDINPKEVEECFYSKSFARVLAYRNYELNGHLRLFRRTIEFDGKEVVLGGIGGVCVAEHMRRRGIATEMIRRGLQVLKDKRCDVACLNADLSKNVYRLYENIGFRLMNRKISFEDINGEIRYDDGTMFIPICSKEIYDHIMDNKEIFHYGKGYW